MLYCTIGQHTLHDVPLTLEDLNKSNIHSAKPAHPIHCAAHPARKEQSGINQALRELKQLETGNS